jgi:hypothetical protein
VGKQMSSRSKLHQYCWCCDCCCLQEHSHTCITLVQNLETSS